jgi:hypothetical protein
LRSGTAFAFAIVTTRKKVSDDTEAARLTAGYGGSPRFQSQKNVAYKTKETRRLREPAGLHINLLAHPEIFRGGFAAVFLFFVAHLGTLIEVAQASSFHGRDVHEDILAAIVGLNKPKSLSRVEPLHSTCRHVRTPF